MQNVLLRPTRIADLEFVLAAESAAENRQFILQWPRDQHIASISSSACAHRIVEDASSGEAVGYVILFGLDHINRSIEFRRLVVTAKGRGYGRAAVRTIKKFAFDELAAHRLWLDVKAFNQRAQRLYESEGFTREGMLRDCIRGESGWGSVYVMSILESEYRRVLTLVSRKQEGFGEGPINTFLGDLLHEFRRHKSLADRAMIELDDQEFFKRPAAQVNPVALIVKHLAGNLVSRWTDFLTTDGEKPSRDRDDEFLLTDQDTRASLLAAWERGWKALVDTVQSLQEADLDCMVTIRGEAQTVRQALLRAVTHIAYHTGQILYLVRLFRPDSTWLTIPPGQSRGQPGTYRRSER